MADVVKSLPEARYSEFLSRIRSSGRAARLMELAVQGTLTSSVDKQAVANGHLMVKGVLEVAAYANAEFALRTLAQLSRSMLFWS